MAYGVDFLDESFDDVDLLRVIVEGGGQGPSGRPSPTARNTRPLWKWRCSRERLFGGGRAGPRGDGAGERGREGYQQEGGQDGCGDGVFKVVKTLWRMEIGLCCGGEEWDKGEEEGMAWCMMVEAAWEGREVEEEWEGVMRWRGEVEMTRGVGRLKFVEDKGEKGEEGPNGRTVWLV